jgi:hypothetical protein
MADLVYPPVVVAIKAFWKYLDLKFDFKGEERTFPAKVAPFLPSTMLAISILLWSEQRRFQ